MTNKSAVENLSVFLTALFLETVQMGKVTPDTPKPPYVNPIATDEMQIPWLHYGREDMIKLIKGKGEKADKLTYEEYDKRFNGVKALNWVPHVEYYLNLAASGKDKLDKFVDWEKYSRIIGVTRSGSVASEMQFFLSEIYANESGRTLAKVLKRFIDEGIKVNILTHSLGARVALSALNVLGDFDGAYDEKIDNLILWEPAVADNAITKNYTREKNPLAMELFPFAHRAAEYIRVMYSMEDGVLGADNRWLDFDDGISDTVRGTYPLKYSFFANKTNAMGDYYPYNSNNKSAVAHQKSEAQLYNLQMECLANMGRNDEDVAGLCQYMESRELMNRRIIENDVRILIKEEMNKANEEWKTELNILRPWSHFRRFPEDADYVQHIISVLMEIIFRNDWKLSSEELAIRPALGHQGERLTVLSVKREGDDDVPLSGKEKKEFLDSFIVEQYKKKFHFFDQSAYFTSHSAIKDLIWEEMTRTEHQHQNMEPTRFSQIYFNTYKLEIMDKYIKGSNSKFGRY